MHSSPKTKWDLYCKIAYRWNIYKTFFVNRLSIFNNTNYIFFMNHYFGSFLHPIDLLILNFFNSFLQINCPIRLSIAKFYMDKPFFSFPTPFDLFNKSLSSKRINITQPISIRAKQYKS